ncbi:MULTISPECIES: PucR family transcriptional regulator [Nocardiaceae]|uniref:PucR family transcriptional regulator n=1 Tax=Nocardiaceae TaxID=85025 RepID=UPI001E398E11|nr:MULTISPECIES: helix-turn-helix domain-containing protein [Rhodococcus]MCC8929223.1 helix-turn-helix domain-containing protein [Rhodococcus sp. I2R]MCZ4276372.1 helix-turn-helix domain-containing protein [Rhodococcus yunnanensis]
MSADDMVMAWLREFAAEALVPGTLDGLVARFDAAIVAEVPEVSADRELRRDLDASTRGQGRALLIWLTDDSAEVDLPLAAHDLARTIARRGLHLRVLMQIYRVGQKALLRFAAETASERITDPVLEPKVLIRLLERANHWLNVSLEILTDTYSEERERGLSGAFARQAETVQAIIRGEIVDAAAASNRLNYPLIRHNTALVLWFDNVPSEQTEDVIGVLNSVVRAVAATIGARQLLTLPSGSRGLWAWLSMDVESDLAAVDIGADIPAGISIAMGNPGKGIRGFRQSHTEAVSAQHISEHQEVAARPILYADVEIIHLLDGHPDAARALVSRELRGLDGTDAASTQLRRTLRTYLNVNRSPDAAARALGVHKNTVRYRIQRAEEMLGHPIGANRLKLELALEYADTYGPAIHE